MRNLHLPLAFFALPFIVACGASAPAEDEASRQSAYAMLGSDPQAWRAFWSGMYAGEINRDVESTPAQPPFDGTRTVLLIPGTTIGGEFFTPMAARLARDGFEPVVWTPTDLFTGSLATGAQGIGDAIEQTLAERGEQRLHVVAECDGGVAARYYAERLGGSASVDQLVTFVSAHHGSYAAPVGASVTGWQALRDIKPWSAFLRELDAAPMPSDLKLTSIYTCWDEYLWPYTASRVAGATNVEFCGHYIGHFDGFWDELVYDRILVTLRGQGDGAPVWY